MAVVKDTVRPLARDRTSFSSSLPRQPMSSRTRTQSATYNASDKNRISRRRGSNMTSAGLSSALQAVAVGLDPNGISIKGGGRSAQARNALGALNTTVYPTAGDRYGISSSAIVEGPPMSATSDKAGSFQIRRASDSTQKISDGKRRGPADLKCEHCGKMYKHHSCLTKHLWEHTPEWGLTSKLLISKHQQVQLLEAASVLLAMNTDGADALMSSGSSDENVDDAASPSDDVAISSADEDSSPPPTSATTHHLDVPYKHRSMTSSTGYSNSYQSVFSTVEHAAGLSSERTPSTSYNDGSGEDQADLAAAVGLLSCSYGTSASQPHGASHRKPHPPVPALPQQYQAADNQLNNKTELEMKTKSEYNHVQRSSSSGDDEEGVFGTMEE